MGLFLCWFVHYERSTYVVSLWNKFLDLLWRKRPPRAPWRWFLQSQNSHPQLAPLTNNPLCIAISGRSLRSCGVATQDSETHFFGSKIWTWEFDHHPNEAVRSPWYQGQHNTEISECVPAPPSLQGPSCDFFAIFTTVKQVNGTLCHKDSFADMTLKWALKATLV